jgi:lysophospholipase L1-like esterase
MYKKYSLLFTLIIVVCILFSSSSLFGQAKTWVGTWACAVYPLGSNNTTFPPEVANNTVRQIVRVSIGGDTIRIKFSNQTAKTALTMNSVNIAVSNNGTTSVIKTSTMKQLEFDGNASVTIPAGGSVASDAIEFPLTPNMRLAITINYGACNTDVNMTAHVAARTNSYLLTGNRASASEADSLFTGAGRTVFTNWLTISAIEVLADTTKTHAVACIGNSITDGYGLSGGLQNRWTDLFSQKLLKNPSTANVGVLNLGIGASNVTGTGSTTGVTRFQNDVLNQSGLKWIIIFYGINDIRGGKSASTITTAYETMINAAHAKGIKVYGATITPNGTSIETIRSAVNKWIRTSGKFDGVIDFDKVIRNPSDTTEILAKYNKDGLHPNEAGYKVLGESIDLNLFSDTSTISDLSQ